MLNLCFVINFITTTISPTVDYSRLSSQNILLGNNTDKVDVLYHVEDDNIAEPNETLTVSITKAANSSNITLDFNISSANITIIDDDSEDII